MSSLKVLLIGTETAESQYICSVLERAKHDVFPLPGFDEAAEALQIQKFDVVLLAPAVQAAGAKSFITQLRQAEQSQRHSGRIPVVSVSAFSGTLDGGDENDHVDAILPGNFEPSAFAETVGNLASAVTRSGTGAEAQHGSSGDPGLEIFSASKFEEQVAYDQELMVEIIDLFLAERQHDLLAMTESLAAGDLNRLMRSAHTIKGSLASLHAHLARHRSQELETAAKTGNRPACVSLLAALEQDLNNLEPQLLSLRDSVSAR